MRGPVATGKGRIRSRHSVDSVSYRMIVSAPNRFEAVPVEGGRPRGLHPPGTCVSFSPSGSNVSSRPAAEPSCRGVTWIPDALERRQSRLAPTRTGRKQVILTDPCGLRRGHECGISHEISYVAPSKTKMRPPWLAGLNSRLGRSFCGVQRSPSKWPDYVNTNRMPRGGAKGSVA